MNQWISSCAGPVFAWLADYYLAASLLLLSALVGRRWVRQPAHRILIAWTLMFELIALAVVCMLPFWPRVSLFVAAPPSPVVAAVEPPPIVEQQPAVRMPDALDGPRPTPTMAGREVVEPVAAEPFQAETQLAQSPAAPPAAASRV